MDNNNDTPEKRLIADFAEWSNKYPRGGIYSIGSQMDEQLIALEERAKILAALQPSTLPLIEDILMQLWEHGYNSNRENNPYINSYRTTAINKAKVELKSVPLIDKGSEAIEFAEWISDQVYQQGVFTTKQLYDIFKNSKQ